MAPGGQGRRIGKLLPRDLGIVLIVAAYKEPMRITRFEVEASSMRAQFHRTRGIETEPARVEIVTDSVVIDRISLRGGCKHSQRSRININDRRSGRQTICRQSVDLRRRQRNETTNQYSTLPNSGVERYLATPETCPRHGSHHAILFGITPAFVVVEKEEAIFHDRSANAAAEQITYQLRARD